MYRANTLNYTTVVNYLQYVSNFKHRKTLKKLRASDHKLNIEVGRHNKLLFNKRLCKFFNFEDIEYGKHFFLNCSLFDNLRKTLFDNASTNLTYLNKVNTVTQFNILFNPRGRVAVHISRFVHDVSILRKSTC